MNAVSERIPIKLCKHQRGRVVGALHRHGDGSIAYYPCHPHEPGVDAFCSLDSLEAFYRGEIHTVDFRLPPKVLQWPCPDCQMHSKLPFRKITDFFRRAS
tara:strand:- start:4152 stop:4451 length:300 start_codon:yes stop_codon:yes gene_type:complete